MLLLVTIQPSPPVISSKLISSLVTKTDTNTKTFTQPETRILSIQNHLKWLRIKSHAVRFGNSYNTAAFAPRANIQGTAPQYSIKCTQHSFVSDWLVHVHCSQFVSTNVCPNQSNRDRQKEGKCGTLPTADIVWAVGKINHLICPFSM